MSKLSELQKDVDDARTKQNEAERRYEDAVDDYEYAAQEKRDAEYHLDEMDGYLWTAEQELKEYETRIADGKADEYGDLELGI